MNDLDRARLERQQKIADRAKRELWEELGERGRKVIGALRDPEVIRELKQLGYDLTPITDGGAPSPDDLLAVGALARSILERRGFDMTDIAVRARLEPTRRAVVLSAWPTLEAMQRKHDEVAARPPPAKKDRRNWGRGRR